MTCLYNKILLSKKEKQKNPNVDNDVNESQKYCTEWKKTDTEDWLHIELLMYMKL